MGKQLYRSRSNKVIAGVCGGVADYFNIDPTIVRIIWVAVGLTFGAGIVAYIIAAIVMPEDEKASSTGANHYGGSGSSQENDFSFNAEEWKETPKPDSDKSRNIVGAVLIILGLLFLAKQFFNWLDIKVVLPLAFIVIGALLVFNGRRNS